MKFHINQIITVAIIASVLLISACGNNKQESDKNPKQEAKAAEAHEEGTATIASLTEEQIKTVGIELGSIQKKGLTATIKANGLLRVPNNNKANVTSIYGGVVKALTVQIGDHVKKGQVIATIADYCRCTQ
ncbi:MULTISPECIES: biotin/lipoyl-binding protein [Olivibacter]|jgi:multidrug efflux pump subunit AcrA (membrane-fusion protein)|uniref:Biotin/lipoyl-binding protein n=2 Tax=Olivibacter TaxID=376469 RepID=A0ABV6HR83_9SPHI|nr:MULTISPECIES: biotin/lipoyl-binding protein [Olivibacter]MDX3917436.1 biotin/lipoyl-binding protein [Pseudosphingobacterium sp.]QEL03939.1 biotin/lipoyl-binding protein [Olivibacter sp. LS-1]